MNSLKSLALSGFLFSLSASLLLAAEQPNIIYINADDFGIMDAGFMGRAEYRTPHLDKLAARGMVFTNAYAPAANCAPSRAICLSGQSAPRHGVYTVNSSDRGESKTKKLIPIENTLHLKDDNLTLLAAFQQAGYATGHFGKWHVTKDPLQSGCDVNFAGSKAGGTNRYFSPYGEKMKNLSDGPKGEHLPKRLTDEAIRFLEANKGKPTFVYLAYYQVHTPIQPRKDLVPKYKDIEGIIPQYAALVEGMDIYIGELMDYLKASGIEENTLILFSSDNGGINKLSDQAPYRAGKGSYYEGGTRVPMIVSWPEQIEAGSRCDVPVIGTDFYPTLLEAADIKTPAGKILDGVSLMPLLNGTHQMKDRALFWHFPIYLQAYAVGGDEGRDPWFRTRPGSSMRFGPWKLHEYFEDGALELYNLDSDVGERVNLADSMPEKVSELKKMLDTWRATMNAPVPMKLNPNYDASYLPAQKKVRKK